MDPRRGASCLETLEQWVFGPSLAAARPVEGVAVKESDHKPVMAPRTVMFSISGVADVSSGYC